MTNSIPFPQQPNAPVRPTIQVFNGSATVIYAYLVINDYAKQVGKVAIGHSKAHTYPTRYMQIRGGHREYGKTQEDMIRAFVKAGYNVEDNTWEKAGGVRVTRYHYALMRPSIITQYGRFEAVVDDLYLTVGRKPFKVGVRHYGESDTPDICNDKNSGFISLLGAYMNKHHATLTIPQQYSHFLIKHGFSL